MYALKDCALYRYQTSKWTCVWQFISNKCRTYNWWVFCKATACYTYVPIKWQYKWSHGPIKTIVLVRLYYDYFDKVCLLVVLKYLLMGLGTLKFFSNPLCHCTSDCTCTCMCPELLYKLHWLIETMASQCGQWMYYYVHVCVRMSIT